MDPVGNCDPLCVLVPLASFRVQASLQSTQLLRLIVLRFLGAWADIGACFLCDGASKRIFKLGQVSSSTGKNCVTLGAHATGGVMQILDEAVELPQDSIRVPSPRSAYPTRITSETLLDDAFVVKLKVEIVGENAEFFSARRKIFFSATGKPHEPSLNGL